MVARYGNIVIQIVHQIDDRFTLRNQAQIFSLLLFIWQV